MGKEGVRSEIEEGVNQGIVASVVAGLGPEAKEKVLQAALAEYLGSYKFSRMVEKEIEKIAQAEIGEYLKNPDVVARIRREAIAAAEQFIGALVPALRATLAQNCLPYEARHKDFAQTMKKLLGVE